MKTIRTHYEPYDCAHDAVVCSRYSLLRGSHVFSASGIPCHTSLSPAILRLNSGGRKKLLREPPLIERYTINAQKILLHAVIPATNEAPKRCKDNLGLLWGRFVGRGGVRGGLKKLQISKNSMINSVSDR